MKFSKPIRFHKKRRFKLSELHAVYDVLRKTFGHQDWWPGDTPFEVMVGAILTQNTAWTNVEKAIRNLKRAKKLSLRVFRTLSREELAAMIRPTGYFNIKADRLKHFTDFLIDEYQGDLRRMKREPVSVLRGKLLAVKGIGPETADSMLLYALDKKSFVIDAYTKRIFSRHGVAAETDDYSVWQGIFTRTLPKQRSLYNDYHAQIVRLAKDYCRKAPVCDGCPLKNFGKNHQKK